MTRIPRRIPLAIACFFGLTASADAATHYVTPSGSDAAACTQPAPCQSMARSYAGASPVQVVARQQGDLIELRVVDHGPGIPGPERERVFNQFYRLKRGGRRPEGTGMGLAICRGIVQAHGGSLRVETTPGGGATFVLTLPVSPAPAPDPVADREAARP